MMHKANKLPSTGSSSYPVFRFQMLDDVFKAERT